MALLLHEVTGYLDSVFEGFSGDDVSNNGLQVEASKHVSRVSFAVDACQATIDEAIGNGSELLVVHHGLSWGNGWKRLEGIVARRMRAMFKHGLSLYAMHLPLDVHPEIGNNVILCNMLGLRDLEPFFSCHGVDVGYFGTCPEGIGLENLAACLDDGLGTTCKIHEFGSRSITRVGVVSGGGDDAIEECARLRIPCLVTGELLHQRVQMARELGVSVIVAGHYATETTGIKELRRLLGEKLSIPTEFIDAPTGL